MRQNESHKIPAVSRSLVKNSIWLILRGVAVIDLEHVQCVWYDAYNFHGLELLDYKRD
jgi:hypothetical protein